ncbi:2Fe-2S iron-sulfur cluster-binding protein [Aquimarina rhabdastrellae]
MSTFYNLKVIDVVQETSESVVIAFDVPYELYETFDYKPGQYVTLKFNINGEEVRRSYSLCSSPVLEEPLRIGVKRVKDGLVSNYINDNIRPGDFIEVMPADGRFYADVKKSNYKTYYLFAAGSGITPILSILRTVLVTEERSYVYMFYGNKSEETIMFKKELDTLLQDYGDRFILEHTLSRPKAKWSDLWNTKQEEYRKGRVDEKSITWFINEYPLYAQNAEYYICGPGAMIANTEKALQQIDVPSSRIYKESFGGKVVQQEVAAIANAALNARLNGKSITTTIPQGKTILRALIDQKYNPPYSCEGGVCSTCKCKLKEGKVHMHNNLSLDEEEVAAGYILSCQSVPMSDKVTIEYS